MGQSTRPLVSKKECMKRIGIILAVFLLWAGFVFAKGTDRKLHLTTTPEKPELFVNQKTDPYTIRVEYTLNIPAGFVPDRGRLIYVPRFVAPGQEYSLSPVVITGKKFKDKWEDPSIRKKVDFTGAKRIESNGAYMRVKINQVIPFQLWMTQSRFGAMVIVQDRKKAVTYNQALAEGVIYIPLGPGPALVKYVKKEVPVSKVEEFHFHYPVNVSYIRPNVGDNLEQLNALSNLLLRLDNVPDMRLEHIELLGIGSPNGSLAYNEKLAMKRIQHLLDYLKEGSGWENGKMNTDIIAQDWDGLRKEVENSDMPGKREVLQILTSSGNDARRLQLLQKSPQYSYLVKHIFPQLQQTVCKVYYTVTEVKTVPVPE